MDEVLEWARAAVADLQAHAPWAASSEQYVTVIDAVQVLIGQLTAVQAGFIIELDGRGYPSKLGATSTRTWLRDRLRISIHPAKRLSDLGTIVHTRPAIADAITTGTIGIEQAAVIAAACADLPTSIGPALVDDCETALIEHAAIEPRTRPIPGDNGRDLRLPAQRRADALVDVCNAHTSPSQSTSTRSATTPLPRYSTPDNVEPRYRTTPRLRLRHHSDRPQRPIRGARRRPSPTHLHRRTPPSPRRPRPRLRVPQL